MIISYKVSPFWGIKTDWVTEITHIKELEYFVDEQRMGPYVLWHHQHWLIPQNNGVLMKDIVTYAPPMGFLGAIANKWFIELKLKEIFAYRWVAIEKLFNP
ncbi:MAG: SRPBCC family protein [Flavobacteriaceae bacterium]|nr:SRPBCC family protein [Flavobacteriaceae bacterium]